MRRILSTSAVLAALVVVASPSFAGLIDGHNPPDIGPPIVTLDTTSVTLQLGSPTFVSDSTDPTNPEKNYWTIPSLGQTVTTPSGPVTVSAGSQQFDSDPIIGYSLNFDNTTNAPLTINMSKTVIVGGLAGPTQYKGTIGISLTDDDGGGATVSSNGTAIYQASIDGTPVLELFNQTSLPGPFNAPEAFSFSVPEFGSDTTNANSGYINGGPAIVSTMTISLSFVLSPNDSIGITSNFVVLPGLGGGVPEPTSLALLGLGAVGLIARRRK